MKRKLPLLLLFPLTCAALPFTVIPDKTNIPILAPQFSQRQTAKIQLPNGLQALIVSDPNLEESGAALLVQAGSWDDPDEHPGLAHFLEHMLFLGTKKYPNEGEYRSHLQSNGGIYNAFTANNFTAYFFTVNTTAFPEALDRFSNFFIDPLFNPSGVAREINAIDQEYAKNLENDDFRTYFVYKDLLDPSHPEHRFNIGSNATLSNTKQEVLKNWFKTNYSANNMRLIVYSSLPLAKLEELAAQDFSPIPNLNRTPKDYGSGRVAALSKQIVYIEPAKEVRKLSLIWELPESFSTLNAARPDSLICYVLGHEGAHSLLDVLKKENLAEEIQCGSMAYYNNPLSIEIEIDLTDKGVNHVYDVIKLVHESIALLNKKGIPEPLYNEIKQLRTIDYQYPTRDNLFMTLAKDVRRLSNEPLDSYPQFGEIPSEYSPAKIKAVLAYLTPDKASYMVTAPAALTKVKSTKIEPWLNVHYTLQPIPESIQKSWMATATQGAAIDLPEPNPFVAKELTLLFEKDDSSALVPPTQTLVNDAFGRVYWAPDHIFGIPKISWSVELKSPQIDTGNPQKAVLTDLTVKAVKNALTDISYPAQIAGLKYNIEAKDFGIRITINGYSEHAPLLLNKIVENIAKLNPSEEQFHNYKKSQLNEYLNDVNDLPVMQGIEIFRDTIFKYSSTPTEKAKAIDAIAFENFKQYTANLYNQMFVEAVFYGNITDQQALATYHNIQNVFGAKSYPPAAQPVQTVVDLPHNEGPYFVQEETKALGNGVILGIETLAYSFEQRGAQQILGEGVSEEFFNELRTKQQTGYIVQCWTDNFEEHLFTLFAVQSKSHDPKELLARFELFLESYIQEFETEFPEVKFNSIRDAIVTKLSTPQRSMKDMGTLLQQLAFKFKGNFNYLNERIEALQNLTYERFVQLAKENLARHNRKRLAVLIHGSSPEQNPTYIELKDPSQLIAQ